MRLLLTGQQEQLLRDEVRKVQPIEACALLFGRVSKREAAVQRIVTLPNALRSTVRFEIDPKAFYDAFVQAQKDGLDFVGLFHSHSAPSFPSSVDLGFMRLWGDAVWLIFSTLDNSLAAFQMSNDRILRLTLRTDKV